ncbi:protein sidekick-like [Anopheles nili]|uniref:protein sidekick-like n=1 Tax=Anopheles nili TaxID=185578 RepID=UPI00237ACA72|nr:protein sidekick-like [Anopheles nili]
MSEIFLIKNRLHQQQLRLVEKAQKNSHDGDSVGGANIVDGTVGASENSEVGTSERKHDNAASLSGPPRGFVGSARSSTEIIIQWKPSLEELRNGQILGYIIRYRLFGYNASPWNYRNITNEAQRNYLIQELITWNDYVIQIVVYNNMGGNNNSTADLTLCRENEGSWALIPERVDPAVTAYIASGLKPHTHYQFRIQATNDLGPSSYSRLEVVPITTTSVRVQWTALRAAAWNGDADIGGYRILYQPLSDFPSALQSTPKLDVLGVQQVSAVLADLTQDRNYEQPFNSQGSGPPSQPVAVYNTQNGELLGYKIFYLVTDSSAQDVEPIPVWDGAGGVSARSAPITVKTLAGLPGPPTQLLFSDITMNILTVSGDVPQKRNGLILGNIVAYETTEDNEKFSKQVKQKVTGTSLLVQNLEEVVTYTFTVRLQTIDYGPAINGNVTTGPQDGLLGSPRELTISKSQASVQMHWINGQSGKGPILGYYIETKKRDDLRWETVARTTNGPLQEFTVSFQNLLPSTAYKFRVISYNRYGISCPVYSEDAVLTPSKLYLEYGFLQLKPFYRQTWFMVALAATSIVIVIMVVAVLCVKSKSYKYKQEVQKTLEESIAMSIDERQELALELYRSRHGTSANGSVLQGASESENESVRSDPHSFVNHYVNNDLLRQSWKRKKPVRNYSSYTDSDPEGSAVMSLNGGQIIMNNMARSRAPLPGFSSFV